MPSRTLNSLKPRFIHQNLTSNPHERFESNPIKSPNLFGPKYGKTELQTPPNPPKIPNSKPFSNNHCIFWSKTEHCVTTESISAWERGQILKLSPAKSEINLIADATLLEEGQRQNAAFCVSSPYRTTTRVEVCSEENKYFFLKGVCI